jgi:hypothetical protein
MKKSITYIIWSLAFCLFNLNCSSGGGSDDDPNPEPTEVVAPSVAALAFPEQNSECTTGSNLTSTESTITFDWNDSNNTDSYELFVKNLDNQTTERFTSNISERSVTILRGTPYSWYVVSKNSGTETSKSATWKFYNAGETISSYAPFPADLIAPALSETLITSTTSVNLEWKGEDVDNDIKEYDLFFGTNTNLNTKEATTSNMNYTVTVSSGNTYYWKIITKDNQNNTSESQVFQFSIE